MNCKILLKKILKLLLIIIIFCSEFQSVDKVFASELNFYNYNTKSNVKYSGKQVSYCYNNKQVNLSYPGILISGTALADYEELFVKELGLSATIEDKKITFSDGTTELVLTIGSKTVKLNGKSQKMSVAPVKLEFKDGTIKYYVPTRFVSETFGFNYVYNSKNSEVKITKTIRFSANGKTILYSDTFFSINYDKQLIPSDIKAILYKDIIYAPANGLFDMLKCQFEEENGQILITKNDIELLMHINSCKLSIKDNIFYMEAAPIEIITGNNLEPEIYIPLEYIVKMLGYNVSFDEKKCCYNITDTEYIGNPELHPELKPFFTTNIIHIDQEPIDSYFSWSAEEFIDVSFAKELTKVNAYSIENADVLELYGITKNDVNDFMDNSTIVFELKSVLSDIGTKFYSDNNAPHLKYVLLTTINNSTRLYIMASLEDEWIFEETEDCLKVYFMQSELTLDDLKTFEEAPYDIETLKQEIEYPENRLIIPFPEGYDNSSVRINDNYLERIIQIIVPGNLTDYYSKTLPINPYDFILDVEIIYNTNTNQTIINMHTDKIYGFEEFYSDSFLALKIGKPAEIYNKIIVLDAGHGGKDPGALRDKIYEKNITLSIINLTEEIFKNSDIKVYCTRITDKYLTLQERVDFVKQVDADLFVSLHINASELEEARGTEVYYSKGNNDSTESGLTSNKLAKALVNNLYVAMDTKLRGVLNHDYFVVHYNTVPAALIELGFISNKEEREKLTNKTYQQKAANAIYESIIEIFSAYPTGR